MNWKKFLQLRKRLLRDVMKILILRYKIDFVVWQKQKNEKQRV